MRTDERWTAFLLAVLLMTLAPTADSQRPAQGRSMTITRGGIVAAESPLAAQAGAQVLARGGSAVDAAIAANAVMGVVSPMMNGIGGDLFAIVYEAKTGKRYGVNASGWAPRGLTPEFLRARGMTKMPDHGIQSVTVPGTVEGWVKLHEKFGRRPLAEDLSAAVRIAEEGYPVTEWVAIYWQHSVLDAREDPAAAKLYLPEGRPPRVGEIFRNPELAAALRRVGERGHDGYYRGETAEKIVAAEKRFGGTMTAEDLADFSAEWAEPISTIYRGWTVYEMPPNGQGIAALMMLNILGEFDFSGAKQNSADVLHTEIEAKKLAYADMLHYVADPRYAKVPVAELLSGEHARARARQVDARHASCAVGPLEVASSAADGPAPRLPVEAGDTTYLSAVDREGNMVSLIQSNYDYFGSGIVADGAGFALQNRGALFSLEAGSPNLLAGRKRPLHTIIPAQMEKGTTRIAFGIMGGWNQSQAHVQFVVNLVDFGFNIQAALEAPRFTKRTFEGCDVEMEDGIPAAVRAELESRGHKISVHAGYSPSVGGGQAVMRDFATGINYGASDPRKDGAAIPEPEK
ncbi:MAG TPA: gamma-glutamyltransferase family protein [Candidatus Acidoferrales bacterium]|nr:gamma-glutamyltransferase family protein [Candidatus Acidoferrales bacterium]